MVSQLRGGSLASRLHRDRVTRVNLASSVTCKNEAIKFSAKAVVGVM